jgi:hypothetical protein
MARGPSSIARSADRAGCRPHPEDHDGHEGDRDDAREAADHLLALEGQLAGAEGQGRTEQDRERHGHADPGPDVLQSPGALGLDEEGDEDDHDQRGLQAFAQPDEGIGDEHKS